MRRCLACHGWKPESDFPARGALACNFCTPVSDKLSAAIMPDSYSQSRIKPSLDFSGGLSRDTSMYDNVRTQRATVKDDSVKRALLDKVRGPREVGLDEVVDISSGKERFTVRPKVDNRPLIDRVQEATFHDDVGMQWIGDKYALRMLLRKAHCFTIDDVTSELISDFSLAIKDDLESARKLAIPPFPVTWIDFNNAKRIARSKARGVPMTDTALGKFGDVVERVGWLIHPADIGGQYMTYFTATDQGIVTAPMSYWWHNGRPNPHVAYADREPGTDDLLQGMALGGTGANCDVVDAYPCPSPMHTLKTDNRFGGQVRELMLELAGELRHVWGLLIAVGAGQFGADVYTAPQPLHSDIRKMPNGKPLLPLEHKILHLHLRKTMTPEKVLARVITHHKHRWHEVRSHWRTLKNADGSVKARVPVKAHERGDERLGKIVKTYKVEK